MGSKYGFYNLGQLFQFAYYLCPILLPKGSKYGSSICVRPEDVDVWDIHAMHYVAHITDKELPAPAFYVCDRM